MKKIILLFGPTASGKSKLAIDLAQNYNGEIVNADSMQVYSEIKILSARLLGVSSFKILIFFCKIIFPESNLSFT